VVRLSGCFTWEVLREWLSSHDIDCRIYFIVLLALETF